MTDSPAGCRVAAGCAASDPTRSRDQVSRLGRRGSLTL